MKKKRNGPTTNLVRLINMTEATQNAMYKFVPKITPRTTCSSTGYFRPRNSNILTEREKSEMGRLYIGELFRRLLKKKPQHDKEKLHRTVSTESVALWSSGRHLASGSEGPGFESWLCQVDVESLGKALYMHFPHPTHV